MSSPSRQPSALAGLQAWERGPVTPPPPAAAPRPPQRPPLSAGTVPAGPPAQNGVSWVGAHGGAGTTSLAAALGGADVGVRWPDIKGGEPGRMVIVARTHAAGIQAASTVLDSLRSGDHPAGLHLLTVALVADAPGRLPLSLSQRVRVLSSVATVHRVPWIPSWRLGKRTAQMPGQVLALGQLISGSGG